MQEKWLIAVDLDGTLFNTDHQISPRTLDTLAMLTERGHSVVIVTGRSSHSALPKLLSIPAGALLVCSNGAYEYDLAKQEIVWANYLAASTAVAIKQRIIDQIPSASFGWESKKGLNYEPKFIHEAGGAHTLEQGGCHDHSIQNDVLKIFARTPDRKGDELAKHLLPILNNEFEVSTSGAPFVEITAAGVNKGNALAKVASNLGFKSDRTIAFGDNHNDLSMLRWAGESVAMGNAVIEVQAVANSMTSTNSEDGVAHFLENKLLNNAN